MLWLSWVNAADLLDDEGAGLLKYVQAHAPGLVWLNV